MNIQIFDFKDYRSYLKQLLKSYPKKGHGIRSHWANAMGCQGAYVSHVLHGHNDLSVEQGEALSRFLAHNKDEAEYWLMLIQKERAGTHQLKKFYRELIDEKIAHRENIRERMKIKDNLNLEDQAIYYSHWLYAAVHILLTIPKFQTQPEKIAEYFNASLMQIRSVLNFLEMRKLITLKEGRHKVENNFLFINKNSPLFAHQQSCWRQKAIESIYQNKPEDIHFSSVFTISEVDVAKVKEILLKSIEASTDVIKPSKEEKLYSIGLDFFEMK